MFAKILAGVGAFFLDMIETIVMALAIFVVVYLFLFRPHEVVGNSMFPNFHDGELILTDIVSYRFGLPKRGDVVVFKSPQNKDIDYIKRIIGLPGETIRVEAGYAYVNNAKLDEIYLPADYLTNPGAFLSEGQSFTVPEESYMVFGDNRNHSSDSREFGAIKKEDFVGRAFLRYWPLSRLTLVKRPTYDLNQ